MKAKSKPTFPFPALLEPVVPDKPCGEDLEYDPEFVVLLARAAPRPNAQYGDFISAPEAVNWPELERDCHRLLLRTRDIRILVLLLRCRVRLGHAAGLRDGLGVLAQLLAKWPDAIHPQLLLDGEADPAMRANALAALSDPEGLMQDVRELPIAETGALRLQVRDVERALGLSRPADAMEPESVRRQLLDLRQQRDPAMTALDEAAASAAAIDDWARVNLANDCPDLTPLRKLLGLVASADTSAIASAVVMSTVETLHEAPTATPEEAEDRETTDECQPTPLGGHSPASLPTARSDALASIRIAREWFETHEPSSPVALLLRQAERLTGKRFDEVFQAIPADLVARWAQELP